MLGDEDLEHLEPKASRDIEISRFVKSDLIDQEWYARPYFLGPEGKPDDYFALADALAADDKVGVAHWVMRKREYVGALRAHGSYLLLVSLHHTDEVILASELPKPPSRAITAKERTMAEQLIDMYSEEFDPALYHDEYKARVLELVRRKAAGKKLAKGKVERLPRARPLADALKASIDEARKRRHVA
jgi:DNA end-binding protein Ku